MADMLLAMCSSSMSVGGLLGGGCGYCNLTLKRAGANDPQL